MSAWGGIVSTPRMMARITRAVRQSVRSISQPDRVTGSTPAAATLGASQRHQPRSALRRSSGAREAAKPIQLPEDPVAASYAIGGVLQIELSRKQRLLELPDAASRLRAELALLRRESSLLDDGALPPVQASDLGYHPN